MDAVPTGAFVLPDVPLHEFCKSFAEVRRDFPTHVPDDIPQGAYAIDLRELAVASRVHLNGSTIPIDDEMAKRVAAGPTFVTTVRDNLRRLGDDSPLAWDAVEHAMVVREFEIECDGAHDKRYVLWLKDAGLARLIRDNCEAPTTLLTTQRNRGEWKSFIARVAEASSHICKLDVDLSRYSKKEFMKDFVAVYKRLPQNVPHEWWHYVFMITTKWQRCDEEHDKRLHGDMDNAAWGQITAQLRDPIDIDVFRDPRMHLKLPRYAECIPYLGKTVRYRTKEIYDFLLGHPEKDCEGMLRLKRFFALQSSVWKPFIDEEYMKEQTSFHLISVAYGNLLKLKPAEGWRLRQSGPVRIVQAQPTAEAAAISPVLEYGRVYEVDVRLDTGDVEDIAGIRRAMATIAPDEFYVVTPDDEYRKPTRGDVALVRSGVDVEVVMKDRHEVPLDVIVSSIGRIEPDALSQTLRFALDPFKQSDARRFVSLEVSARVGHHIEGRLLCVPLPSSRPNKDYEFGSVPKDADDDVVSLVWNGDHTTANFVAKHVGERELEKKRLAARPATTAITAGKASKGIAVVWTPPSSPLIDALAPRDVDKLCWYLSNNNITPLYHPGGPFQATATGKHFPHVNYLDNGNLRHCVYTGVPFNLTVAILHRDGLSHVSAKSILSAAAQSETPMLQKDAIYLALSAIDSRGIDCSALFDCVTPRCYTTRCVKVSGGIAVFRILFKAIDGMCTGPYRLKFKATEEALVAGFRLSMHTPEFNLIGRFTVNGKSLEKNLAYTANGEERRLADPSLEAFDNGNFIQFNCSLPGSLATSAHGRKDARMKERIEELMRENKRLKRENDAFREQASLAVAWTPLVDTAAAEGAGVSDADVSDVRLSLAFHATQASDGTTLALRASSFKIELTTTIDEHVITNDILVAKKVFNNRLDAPATYDLFLERMLPASTSARNYVEVANSDPHLMSMKGTTGNRLGSLSRAQLASVKLTGKAFPDKARLCLELHTPHTDDRARVDRVGVARSPYFSITSLDRKAVEKKHGSLTDVELGAQSTP